MLKITIPESEDYNSETNEFIYTNKQELTLEHSLISISKWEEKWHISLISNMDKLTRPQLLDYIRCMTLDKNVDPRTYTHIPNSVLNQIKVYIDDSHTATSFRKDPGSSRSRQIITSELIYSWMVGLNIPFECQKWHVSRLMTLIRCCEINNDPKKNKMSKSQLAIRNRELNEARRAMMHSKG